MTQSELAAHAAIDADTVSAVEAGGGTITVLVAILTVLGAKVDGHDPTELGSWLRNARVGKGLSQQCLATKAGISKPTVIGLERGRGHVASFTAAVNALGVDIRLDLTLRSATALRDVERDKFAVVQGDAQSVLSEFPDHHFHACVCDPPYGLTEYPSELVNQIVATWVKEHDFDFSRQRSYLNADWDGGLPQPSTWRQVHRVLRPGGYLLAFAAPRTADLLTLSLRLAGFEIRDQIAWITTNGMPRTQDVGRMLRRRVMRAAVKDVQGVDHDVQHRHGGEPVNLARRRYPVAGARMRSKYTVHLSAMHSSFTLSRDNGSLLATAAEWDGHRAALKPAHQVVVVARRPLEGLLLDNVMKFGAGTLNVDACRVHGEDGLHRYPSNFVGDIGPEFAKHFFAPRATSREKDRYLPTGMINSHPTVKPVELMRWLVRLVTTPGAMVLDPFMGSGTTGIACMSENRQFIGIDMKDEYVEMARCRIHGWR
ncbi:DNA methyltransferase [Azospirillum brasilense]|uniref:DNA methyltransferase n=1 Tax=Azospirillum brasilense TaxID=192 RepID=UPI000E0BC32E|nr:DNA methyltransferase [Azospirillum brasilense]